MSEELPITMEQESVYWELLREAAYGIGMLLAGAMFGAVAAYVYFSWKVVPT